MELNKNIRITGVSVAGAFVIGSPVAGEFVTGSPVTETSVIDRFVGGVAVVELLKRYSREMVLGQNSTKQKIRRTIIRKRNIMFETTKTLLTDLYLYQESRKYIFPDSKNLIF